MASRRKRPPLLSSLSVQLPSSNDEEAFEGKYIRRHRRKESFQTSFTSPKEDEEFLLPEINNKDNSKDTTNSFEKLCNPDLTLNEKSEESKDGVNIFLSAKESDSSQSPLIEAITTNQIDEVVKYIEAGEDLEREDEFGFKPLHYACKVGSLETIKQLIKKDCEKYATNCDHVTSLHVAVRSGRSDVVALLLEEGVIPDVREKKWGRTPVHEATLLGNYLILKTIITQLQEDPWEAQRILKISDKDGQTALHIASSKCLTESIGLLLAAGADVAATDNEGLTPMHAALLSHRGKRRCGGVLTQLLEAGGDVEVEGGIDNEHLSHFAARAGCSICLEFLHKRGADLMAKNKLGRTPLHIAAIEGEFDAATFLMSKVHLDAADNNGQRPLHLAILNDNPKTIEALISAGADPLARDKDERTYVQLAVLRRKMNAFHALVRSSAVQLPEEMGEDIIHYCSALGFINSVTFLLENGWDINLQDSKGRTALHRALNHGHEEMATMLINNGASLQQVDGTGATPLHFAVRWGGSDAILRLLVKKKANLGVRDRLGRTPLHYAASKFSIMSDLYILLGGGSVLDSQDHMGLTPLHLAARLGNESLVRILLENGAKHDIKDLDNFLPIDHAIEKKNKSIIKRLQSHDKKLHSESEENDLNEVETTRLSQHRKSLAW